MTGDIFSYILRSILRWTIYSLVGIGWLAGLVVIPLYFGGILEHESWIILFTLMYVLFSALLLYYINGIKMRKTKNITTMIKSDFDYFKNGLREFIQVIGALAKSIMFLAAGLLVIGAIILVFVLFGWFIASLSATTIIIILLVLILLK